MHDFELILSVRIWRNYSVDNLRHENSLFAPSVSQVAQDRLQSELLTPHQASFISEQKKVTGEDVVSHAFVLI